MNLSLSNMLSSNASGIDPDAKAYIAAVVTAGGTVSETQKNAINIFYKTGKTNGWYSSLKRLYFPVWGIAAPNAICMTSLTSGTFIGGVTHGSGFVQGNGSTGYFNTGASPTSLSITDQSVHLASLRSVTGSGFEHFIGSRQTPASALSSDNIVLYNAQGTSVVTYSLSKANQIGVIVSNTESGTLNVRRRVTAGSSSVGTGAITTGTLPTINYFCMARNSFGAPDQFSNARYGVFSIGTSLGDSTAIDSFTLAIKNLWEGTTGLTLP